jgi:hypothetical protein
MLAPFLIITPLGRQFPSARLVAQIENDPQFFEVIAKAARRALFPVLGAIICGAVAFLAFGRPAPDQAITPKAAVDYIDTNKLKGKIYNSYNFGGYLIFRHVDTFIDGRAGQLFLEGFMDKLHATIDHHPRQFLAYLDSFDIKLGLVLPDSMEAQEFEASPAWEKVYSDTVSVLYQKRN